MSTVDRQVNQARWRMTANVVLRRLTTATLLAAGAWTLTILVVRAGSLPVPLWTAAGIAAAMAGAAGLTWGWLTRPSALEAAVALDQAAAQKARLSTALLVRHQSDPFAQAAVQDAERAAARVYVPAHIRLQVPRLWPWSSAAVATGVLLAWLMPPLNLFAGEPGREPAGDPNAAAIEQQAIQAEMRQQFDQLRKLAERDPSLKGLLSDPERLEVPEKPALTPDDVRRSALKRVDEVRDRLQQELNRGDSEALRQAQRLMRQLEQEEGPNADPLSKALAAGDTLAAKLALADLAKEIEEASQKSQDPEMQAKLAAAQEELERLAAKLAELSDMRGMQAELENKGGLSAEEARELLEELARLNPDQIEGKLREKLSGKGLSEEQIKELAKRLAQRQQAQKTCRNLSKSLSRAAKSCNQCRNPASSQSSASDCSSALADAASQLSEMELAEQTAQELQAQLSEMESLRDRIRRGQCQSTGSCAGSPNEQVGPQGPAAGRGTGERVGRQETDYQTKAEKASSRSQGGVIIGRMLVEGPQVRGEATAAERAAVESEVRDAMDAVEREQVPVQYHRALREYFERLAGLMREQPATEPNEPN